MGESSEMKRHRCERLGIYLTVEKGSRQWEIYEHGLDGSVELILDGVFYCPFCGKRLHNE